MNYHLILGCPRCGQYKSLSTSNLCKVRFGCFCCGLNTTRSFTNKYGVHNFRVGVRNPLESESDCVKRLNAKKDN